MVRAALGTAALQTASTCGDHCECYFSLHMYLENAVQNGTAPYLLHHSCTAYAADRGLLWGVYSDLRVQVPFKMGSVACTAALQLNLQYTLANLFLNSL